jgi:aspartate aminotransferase-like enzyme
MLSHRGPEFTEILRRTEEMLQPVLGTRNRVLFFASTGTGMMEASLVNILAHGERVLVSAHGQFGQRFGEIAKALGAQVDMLDVPWGHAPEPAEVARRIACADYRAFVVVHNESSTGVVADLAGIGAALRNSRALLVVDSVSGLGGIEMRQDEWGVDILVSASQKALMCPPGLGILSMSAKAWSVVNREDRLPRFYWDLRKAVTSAGDSETPFTTPVALIAALHEALLMIHEEGLPAVLDRHARLSTALRVGCEELGLRTFAETDRLSNTVVCLRVPEGLNGRDIVRTMYQRHGTVIAGSRNHLQGKVIRIGAMGAIDAEDIATDLRHLEATLKELNGLRAAQTT